MSPPNQPSPRRCYRLGQAIRAAGMKRVGLLGTRFTMEQPFYRQYLNEHFALEVVVPGDDDRTTVHNVIYDELVAGIVRDESRAAYRAVWDSLRMDNLTTEMTDQLYTLSQINRQKYAALDRLYAGLMIMALLLGALIGTIALHQALQ